MLVDISYDANLISEHSCENTGNQLSAEAFYVTEQSLPKVRHPLTFIQTTKIKISSNISNISTHQLRASKIRWTEVVLLGNPPFTQ